MLLSPIAYLRQEDAEEFARDALPHVLLQNPSRHQGVFPAALLKLLSYSEQNEVRAIFQEAVDQNQGNYIPIRNDNDLALLMKIKSNVDPLILKVPEARKYVTPCSRT